MPTTQQLERILGIDPGFGRVGYGVVERAPGKDWVVVTYGCITTSPKESFVERLKDIHEELVDLIKTYPPTRIAVEKLFFMTNVKTAMQVGEARGVILLTAIEAGMPIDEFTPQEVKQAITGYGAADKIAVEKMVRTSLNIKKKITPDDAADALAIALTAGHSVWLKKLNKKL